MNNSVK